MVKQTKVVIRRKKFQEVDVPLIKSKIELIGDSISDIEGKTIKLDLTRQLKGKSMEVVVKVVNEEAGKSDKSDSGHKAVAYPVKMKLMSYFIRRMIRKKISYVEESLQIPSQESMLIVKPFLITRNRVSRAVRKALRNRAKNWLEDYISQMTDKEVFDEVLSNRLQKPLSLVLKKTYPLSLCEIRVLEIKRPLEKSEVPKKVARKIEEKKEDEGFIDQMAEIEAEKVKAAEDEMKKTQKEAVEKEELGEEEKKKDIEEMKKEVKEEVKEVKKKKEKEEVKEVKKKKEKEEKEDKEEMKEEVKKVKKATKKKDKDDKEDKKKKEKEDKE